MRRPSLLLLPLSFCVAGCLRTRSHAARRPSVYLLTFGQGLRFEQAQARLAAEANSTGLFDHIYNYSAFPDFVLNDPRWSKHLQHLKTGMGFWFWKAPLAKHLLNEVMSEGDILFYSDAGAELGNLSEFARVTQALCTHDLVAYSLTHLEQKYTKGDVFAHFGCPLGAATSPSQCETKQICATYFVMRNTEPSRSFIDVWEELAANLTLIGDAASVAPNDPSFMQHRRDQSLFSMLVKANSPDLDAGVSADFPENMLRHPKFGVTGFHPLIVRDVGYPPTPAKHWILAARNHGSKRRFNEVDASHVSEEQAKSIKDLANQC